MEQEKPLNMAKLEAELAKLIVETLNLRQQSIWMPFVWASGIFVATVTITKFFLV